MPKGIILIFILVADISSPRHDLRLQFNNIREDQFQNDVAPEKQERLWLPIIRFSLLCVGQDSPKDKTSSSICVSSVSTRPKLERL